MKTTISRRTHQKSGPVDDTLSVDNDREPSPLLFAASDETSDLVVDAVVPALTFPMDTNRRANEIFAEVITAPTGAALTIDVHVAGATILSTLITIDAGELDTDTAAVPAVISLPDIPEKSLVEVFITQVGSTIAGAGLKLIIK